MIRNLINSFLWIMLGVFIWVTDIVSSIDPEVTQHAVRAIPDTVESGVVTYIDANVQMTWYTTVSNTIGALFIIGGLALLGVTIYEKYSNKQV